MNLVRAVPFVLLLLAPSARAADEDCLLDVKDIKPQFTAKLPRGFKLVSSKKQKRQIKQVLKLADGYEATVTAGGCAHVTFTIEIKGPALTTKTVGAELVAIAKRVLPTLPMDKDALADPKLMLRALDEARINTLPAQLPCGDSTCQLSLEPEPVKPVKGKPKAKAPKDAPPVDPPGVLTLSYGFVL